MNCVCAGPLLQLFGRLAEVLKNRPVDDFKRSIGVITARGAEMPSTI